MEALIKPEEILVKITKEVPRMANARDKCVNALAAITTIASDEDLEQANECWPEFVPPPRILKIFG